MFTDGSAMFAGTPYSVAAGAAVQALPRERWPAYRADEFVAVYAVVGQVLPSSVPVTSYGGEVFGLLLAAAGLARDSSPAPAQEPVRLVTDCLNAVRRLARYRDRPPDPSDPWGGPLRTLVRSLAALPWP